MTTTVTAPEGYTFACRLTDLPRRGKKTICLGDTRVLIIVNSTGLHAVEDRCPITGRSIAHGSVLDDQITSPVTGARYSLKTGLYVGGGQSPLQSHWLHVLPLCVVDDQVYVRI